jgi:hypothetical protein
MIMRQLRRIFTCGRVTAWCRAVRQQFLKQQVPGRFSTHAPASLDRQARLTLRGVLPPKAGCLSSSSRELDQFGGCETPALPTAPCVEHPTALRWQATLRNQGEYQWPGRFRFAELGLHPRIG